MKFGYLGENKLDVKGNWSRDFNNSNIGKFVIARYYSGSRGICCCIGILEENFRVNDMILKDYKVISKEVYEALTT